VFPPKEDTSVNYPRVFLGGLLGGVVFNAVSWIVNGVVLSERFALLQRAKHLRLEPRLPMMPIYIVMLVLVSIGLVWLYAAARTRLGPGPLTAVAVAASCVLSDGPWRLSSTVSCVLCVRAERLSVKSALRLAASSARSIFTGSPKRRSRTT
jgi:hypothetical protein